MIWKLCVRFERPVTSLAAVVGGGLKADGLNYALSGVRFYCQVSPWKNLIAALASPGKPLSSESPKDNGVNCSENSDVFSEIGPPVANMLNDNLDAEKEKNAVESLLAQCKVSLKKSAIKPSNGFPPLLERHHHSQERGIYRKRKSEGGICSSSTSGNVYQDEVWMKLRTALAPQDQLVNQGYQMDNGIEFPADTRTSSDYGAASLKVPDNYLNAESKKNAVDSIIPERKAPKSMDSDDLAPYCGSYHSQQKRTKSNLAQLMTSDLRKKHDLKATNLASPRPSMNLSTASTSCDEPSQSGHQVDGEMVYMESNDAFSELGEPVRVSELTLGKLNSNNAIDTVISKYKKSSKALGTEHSLENIAHYTNGKHPGKKKLENITSKFAGDKRTEEFNDHNVVSSSDSSNQNVSSDHKVQRASRVKPEAGNQKNDAGGQRGTLSVFINNAPTDISLSELRGAVSIYGEITLTSLSARKDDSFATYYIKFKNVESRERALADGCITVGGYNLCFAGANHNVFEHATVRIQNVDAALEEPAIHKMCSSYGLVSSLTKIENGAVDVVFKVQDGSIADSIVNQLNNVDINGHRWTARQLPVPSEGLTKDMSTPEIRQHVAPQISKYIKGLHKQLQMQQAYLEDLERLHNAILHLREQPVHH